MKLYKGKQKFKFKANVTDTLIHKTEMFADLFPII